jgi:hypothetical protein
MPVSTQQTSQKIDADEINSDTNTYFEPDDVKCDRLEQEAYDSALKWFKVFYKRVNNTNPRYTSAYIIANMMEDIHNFIIANTHGEVAFANEHDKIHKLRRRPLQR